LLAAYLAGTKGEGRGKIWLDEETHEIYQGQTLLGPLAALEQSVLTFLIQRPRQRHTKTDLIINTWPDELRRQGVSDNSLYQVIFSLRQVIEPDPADPVYLVTWRGKPEGGYQFFPEGRPK
jgi:DNA-binding response OmpR family regulator